MSKPSKKQSTKQLKKKKTSFTWTNHLVIVLLVFSFLTISTYFSVNAVINDYDYVAQQLSQHSTISPTAVALTTHRHVGDFLTHQTNELPDLFNKREQTHFHDVRLRLDLLLVLFYVSSIFLITYYIMQRHAFGHALVQTAKACFIGVGIIVVLALLMTLLFTWIFDWFHILTFEQGTYSFDAETERIVQIYPESFFKEVALFISLRIIATLVLVGVVATVLAIELAPKPKQTIKSQRAKTKSQKTRKKSSKKRQKSL